MSSPVIEVSELHKTYALDGVDVHALRGIDLTVQAGEFVAIMGPSGSGKSTLMNILGCLDIPDRGRYILQGRDVTELDTDQLAELRNREIGFVFQFHHLLPEFTALENVMMPGLIAGRDREACRPRAQELLERLNVAARAEHKPNQLSGGEQQRVAVARALFNNPSVVLADEPSGNLDSVHARELHALFFELRKELGQTFVIVTHNEELAGMADRKLTMKDGVI